MGHRVLVALGVFGIAGLCALLASYSSSIWMVTVALWFGAAGGVVLGFLTLLGKVGRAELPDPPWPAPFDPVSNPLVLPGQTPGPSPAPGTVPVPFEKPASGDGHPVHVRPPVQDQPSAAELTDAVVASGKRIVQGMRNVILVLSLLVLVPGTLLMAVVSVFQFRDGQVVDGLMALGGAAVTGWLAGEMIRRRRSLLFTLGE